MSSFFKRVGLSDKSCIFQAYGAKSPETKEESENWYYVYFPTAACFII
jgi:hypothetical protein